MKSKKGFIMSTYVYVILVFFLLLLGTLLIVMNNTKLISNYLKQELINQSDKKSQPSNDYFNTKLNGGYNTEGLVLTNGNEIRYRGSNPKNYVRFNDELWRIIGIFNGNIKLIRNSSLGFFSWDTSASSVNSGNGINEWSKSDLMNELNGDYLNSNLFGDISWYDGANNQKNGVYSTNNGLSDSAQELMIDATWFLGGSTDSVSLEKQYKNERGTSHVSSSGDGVTRTNTWTGKVGLLYPSDFAYASNSSNCYKNIQSEECGKGNWLDMSSSNYWTITPSSSSANEIQVISNLGNINHIKASNTSDSKAYVYPVVYLASDVLISGEGTQDNPYEFTRNKINAIEYLTKKYNNGSNEDGLILVNDNEIRYSGLDVKNYVNFNNETWRIIGIVDGRVKLVRDELLPTTANWYPNTSSGNSWKGSAVEIGLNGNYLTSTGYLGSSLNLTAQNLIEEAEWYTSAMTNTQNTSDAYTAERSGSTISRKVGLIYPSDYGYASSTCNSGDGVKELNKYNDSACTESNWMYTNMSSANWWTISNYTNSIGALDVSAPGTVHIGSVDNTNGIRPAVYLKSDVKISGDGTKENPYKFTNQVQENYVYKAGQNEFTTPATGYYRVELWGAKGGGKDGGLGAYTSGVIQLHKGEKLYLYIGGIGESNETVTNLGGYNGGGNSGNNSGANSYGGGGATDVRYFGNTSLNDDILKWNSTLGLNSRIMVAAGGGGSVSNNNNNGGDGGTLEGKNAKGTWTGSWTYNGTSYTTVTPTVIGATQTSGGKNNYVNTIRDGSFGLPAFMDNNYSSGWGGGAGGGYFTGANGHGTGGSGGSSFISGYAGVNAIRSATNRNPLNATRHYSTKYFIDGQMQSGVNSGDGRAIITYIGPSYERVNSKLNNVRYIKDCINGNSSNNSNAWNEIQAIKNGLNIAYGKTTITSTGTIYPNNSSTNYSFEAITDGLISNTHSNALISETGYQCVTLDLSQNYDLDEIAVWHYFDDGRTYNDNITYVSSDNEEWIEVINKTEAETSNGKRVNAYEKVLPETYQQVEYIESTGTQYIDTLFTDTGGIIGQYTASYTSSVNSAILSSHNISSPYGRNYAEYNFNKSAWELGYGDNYFLYNASINLNEIYHVKFSTILKDAYLSLNNNIVIKDNTLSTISNTHVMIFTNDYALENSNSTTKAKLYSAKIYDSSKRLVRDFIPCYRKSDNVIGLYDLVEGKFYVNKGTGTFNNGNDV